jgi:hypothetical protein
MNARKIQFDVAVEHVDYYQVQGLQYLDHMGLQYPSHMLPVLLVLNQLVFHKVHKVPMVQILYVAENCIGCNKRADNSQVYQRSLLLDRILLHFRFDKTEGKVLE